MDGKPIIDIGLNFQLIYKLQFYILQKFDLIKTKS